MEELIKNINALNGQGFTFWVEQEKQLKYMLSQSHPEKEAALAWVKQNKEKLLELLKFNVKVPEVSLNPYIYKYNVGTQPLSFAQERLWFIERYEQGTNAYNIPIISKLSNNIVLKTLERCIKAIIARHEILRTVIKEDSAGNYYQEVLDTNTHPFEILKVKCKSKEELNEYLREDLTYIYDLSNEYPIRVRIYSLESANDKKDKKNQVTTPTHLLSIVIHHIAFDGWSTDIFLDELREYYRYYQAEKFGLTSQLNLPPLTIQYKDFALWQRSYLTGGILEKQLAYWKSKLESYETLNLHADYTRPAEIDYEGRNISFALERDLSLGLREVAKNLGVSLYSLMLSCYYLMLRVYTGQDDIVIGSPVVNRHYRQIEHLIGFFVNTLALRVNIAENFVKSTAVNSSSTTRPARALRDFIKYVGSEVIEAQLHQDLPFEKLVEELNVPKDTSRHPVFQVMFSLHSFGSEERDNIKNSQSGQESIITPYIVEGEDTGNIAKFDLETFIDDGSSDGVLKGGFIYRISLYKEETIKGFINTYKEILSQVAKALSDEVTKESFKIEDLTYLTKDEKDLILTGWNNTDVPYPRNKTIHQLFEEQVAKTPDRLAAQDKHLSITYDELNKKANRLARYLKEKGVCIDNPVVVAMDRSIDLIITILGISKAGGVYVPTDLHAPAERNIYICQNAQASIVIANSKLEWLDSVSSEIIILNEVESEVSKHDSGNLDISINSLNLSYIIFTSGSTGLPKGVMVSHEGMINHLFCKIRDLCIDDSDIIAQTATQIFDISIWQLLTSVATGGKVVIISEEIIKDPKQFIAIVVREKITILELVPEYAHSLALYMQSSDSNIFKSLKHLLVTGEALRNEVCQEIFNINNEVPIVNAYGPTECSDDVTHFHYNLYQHKNNNFTVIPIGKVLQNLQLYILNSNLLPLPRGAAGELYVGGVGLARGYLNRAGLTARTFIANPFSNKPGERLYKTGDLVRYLPDGNIEFIGRVDHQVKIRGFRIELGEIESNISSVNGVNQVIVLAREDEPGQKRLVAYVVPANRMLLDEEGDTNQQSLIADIRKECSKNLPDYMRPSQIILLAAIPLTPNGKIDRKALPKPEGREGLEAYQAPEGLVENSLASIWKELLQVERVGRNDNFFHLGGHSLIATRLISKIRHSESVEVPLRAIFEHPVLSDLAQVIEQKYQSTGILPPITKTKRDGLLPLSFAQQRLWFIEQLLDKKSNNLYNMQTCIRIRGSLNIKALERTLSYLVDRHETLRTKIITQGEDAFQCIVPTFNFELVRKDTTEDRLYEDIREVISTPFNLEETLFKGLLLKISNLDHVLVLTFHHTISDGWSIGVFNREFSHCYQAFAKGEDPNLVELKIQYADYSVWQREWFKGEVLQKQLEYWTQQLLDVPSIDLSFKSREEESNYDADEYLFKISKATLAQLKTLAHKEEVTLFMLLLAAFQGLLSKYVNQQDIAIGTPIANRRANETEGLIGFFVNTLVIRSSIEANITFKDFLQRAKQTILSAYEHQDIPFEQLVESLNVDRDLRKHSIFQIFFVLQNNEMSAIELGNLEVANIFHANIKKSIFDLALNIVETKEDGLYVNFEYSRHLFDKKYIQEIAEKYNRYLEAILANPNILMSNISILDNRELVQLEALNNTESFYPHNTTIHQLFEEQAEKTPDKLALIYEDKQLSYGVLNSRSNQLSHLLRKEGVTLDNRVGISAPRGIELIIGMLAILKARGAYVPLDPEYPEVRLNYMLEDASINILLTVRGLSSLYQNYKGKIIYLDDYDYLREPTTNLALTVPPDALAYVIYTSGSTGRPKGVACNQGAFINRLYWGWTKYKFLPEETLCLQSSISFVDSTWDIFGALAAGARLVMYKEELSKSIEAILEQCSANKVTRITLVPSLLKELIIQVQENPRILKNAAKILHWEVTGEQFHTYLAKDFKQLLNRQINFLDCYGATEATSVIYKDFTATSGSEYTTCLLSNTQIYLLDTNLNQVPIGAIGEIFIGGVGLARGYLNRPGITSEKFIANPFSNKPGERLYRTGDLARYLPDGNIEFIGREDHQVKIRGFRIELGEVESAINQIDGIGNAIVALDGAADDNKRLIAYFVAYTPSLENTSEQTDALVGQWRDVYDQLYLDQKYNEVNTFDIAGWNNSYTRLPFSSQEMKEWRDSTVDRINSLNPQTILEIGCGTGLLTFSLVGNCKTYIGTDFSSVIVDKLSHALKSLNIGNASLFMARADEVSYIKAVKDANIDAIVLNSIVQYFPNIDYLDEVLLKSIELLNPGKIFIGDIRDCRLIDVLHFSIEAHKIRQNGSELDASTLQNAIKMDIKKEAELLLSPAYFLNLAKRSQKIEIIEILPKWGVYDNELNGFRYDVIIHVNQKDISTDQLSLTEKNKDVLVLEYKNNIDVQDLLKSKYPILIVKGYPNKRVWKSYKLNHEFNNLEASDIYHLEETLVRECDDILSLEDLHSTAKQHGYLLYCHLALENDDSPSKYDLYFYKDQSVLDFHKQHIFQHYLKNHYQTNFSNNPNINIQRRRVDISRVRATLLNNLPEYMIPSLFIELAEMPLTPNGKIDRKALPKPEGREGLEAYQSPEGLIENSLASIWKELLQVERVGRNDNFFHLGGHSLIATRLISKIRQSESVEVPLRAVFEHPVLSDLAHLIEQEYQSAGILPPITRTNRDGLLPLSFAQQRLWFIEQLLVDNNGLYHIPTIIRIKGNLNEKALKQALDYLVSRHEILRTRLVTDNGIGYQEILDSDLDFSLAFKDLTKSKDKDISSFVSYEISKPFISDEALCRALCIKLSEQERVLVITFHHIISDGWSVGIFNKEFSAAYESYARGKFPDLPALPVQYADYSIWQRNWLSGKILEKQLHYWQEQLLDASSLELPTDRIRPSVQSYRGGYYGYYISKDKLDKLRKLSKDEGVTLFMVLFSVFSGVLSKLSNQNDIIIGTPIAGRNSSDVEGLIGFFVNTLALRVDTSGDPGFKELLHRVEKATLGAYEHQDVPFEQLVDHLSIPRDLNRHPLFQVMFVLQNMEITNISMGDLDIKYEYNDEVIRAKFDLTLNAEESPEGLCFGFEYAKDLFDEQSIVRLAKYYDQFLTAIITDAEQRLSSISILGSTELARLAYFNNTDIPYQHNKTIHQLFEEQVEKTSDKIVLIYENKQLSYGGLNDRSNQLSHLLRKEGVALDVLVGISAPRGLEFVIGMLAILKAGGAYVPLDPEYPEDRLNYMLEDAGINILLTVRGLSGLYQNYKGKIIYLDDCNYLAEPTTNLALTFPPDALAYVIYTSGSTGRPKGVGVEQSSILNHMKWMIDEYFNYFTPHLLQRTNPSFDASIWELFLPLLITGKMVFTTSQNLQNPQAIKEIVNKYLVNTIQLVPALIDLLEQEHFFNNLKLRKVFVGGDRLTRKHFNIITKMDSECLVYNLYGPTESTIDASSYKALDLFEEQPIGTPIFNTQMHILDSNLNQVPIRTVGELFIGGAGLARGYINRPGLTAEKFLANPFSDKPGERLYRTGDLARYLPDGNIEFIGRVDHQVKIRGFRIELGEIESNISSVNGVNQVIVLAREDEPGQKRIVAYVVPNNQVLLYGEGNTKQQSFITDIRQECSNSLPDYMQPNQIVLLAEMPVMPNGKIDRKALPKPEGREGLETYQTPEGLIENSLASIWKELLQVERVGRNDNFFHLGGHSLIATRLISKIRQSESVEVPLRAIFEYPVLSDLAHAIEQEYQSAGVLPLITRASVNKKEDFLLSFAQERLWFIEKYEQGTNAYNIPIISKLDDKVLLGVLERSIKAIVDRHEILRTVIKEYNAEGYYQEVLDTEVHPFEVLKVKCTSKEELKEHLREDANYIYDLSNEYPIRVRIYGLENFPNKKDGKNQVTASTHVLSIVIHHIAFDGWSTDIFLDELKEYYRYYGEQEIGIIPTLNLPPLTIQYKDFALWQRSYLTGDILEKQLSYWKSKLEGYETLHLPTDYTRPTEMDYEGRSIPFELGRELSLRLREVAKSLGVSLYSLMLSCYYLMLRIYTGQDDIVIGSPVANRHYSQIQHLIGFFVNTLALRVNTAENPGEHTSSNTNANSSFSSRSTRTLRDFIKHVGSEVIEAQLHQDLPFEKLVEELNIPKDTSRHPIFQVMFSLHSFGSEERDNIKNSQSRQESIIMPYTENGENRGHIYNIAKFDLETFIDDGGSNGVLKGDFNYRVSLYTEDTIKGFITTYKEILSQVAKALFDEVTKESFRIEDLTYLTKEEKSLILTRWNNIDVPYAHNKTIHQLFEEQVERTPDNIAVVYSGEDEGIIKSQDDNNKRNKEVVFTYKELNNRANKLANYLIHNYNISPDTLVPLLLDRSEHMIISILAVLKAGGAYVPMTPNYPNERIKYILKDVELANEKLGIKSTTIITNEIYTKKLLGLSKNININIISADSSELFETLSHELNTQPITSTSSNNLAYIIYTSGTTGKPKGVMQLHGNVMRLFTATHEWYRFGQDDVWTLFHSYVFDFTIWEIWGALLYGGKLVIPSYMVTRDLHAFYDLCKKEKVTVLNQTPSAFYQLIDIATHKASKNQNNNNELLPDLKYIIFGGEALNLSQLKPWIDLRGYSKPKLINMYGITETTVHVTYKEIALQDLDKGSYIGKRIPDLTTYVLSPSISLTPLPIGAIGELYVGGTGLAKGYLNNEALTKEKFIPNPFQTVEEKADTAIYGPMGRNSRLYKTGDLVRWLPDGNLEYIGRTDFQVKIRGYRIELGEIESILGSHLEVKQCVVLAKEHKAAELEDSNNSGGRSFISSSSANIYLVAYYTTDTGNKIDTASLISYLSSRLPDYMIPSVFIYLEKLPLTINGKLDGNSLPKPEGREGLEAYQAPEGLIENSLASIWKKLLQIERVGRNDNFFHLGGNSLLLVKMFYMIKRLLNIQVSIKDIYRTESLATLADIISTSTAHREDTQIKNITLDINKTAAKPIFLIHPIGGLSLSYVPLKKLLPKQHIVGINDPYFGHDNSGFSSITHMSSHYVDVIKSSYDLNNCILGGWSFGGEIAYRMACQLEQEGKKISKLILFDSFSPEVHDLFVEGNDEQLDKQKSDYFFEQSTKRNNALRVEESLPKFNGQIYLIKATAYDPTLSAINKNIMSQQKDNGWGDYCDKITVMNVNLSHPELFEEETIHILTQELRNII